MEERKENNINITTQQHPFTQSPPLQESNISTSKPPEKIKKSINHIGLIVMIISLLILSGIVFSIVFTFILSKTNTLSQKDILFLTNEYTQNPLLILTGFISVTILGVTIFLANKLRKDNLDSPKKTRRNLLIITLVFVLNFLLDLLGNGLYSTATTPTSSEVTFNIPIFQVIVIIVLIKGLLDLKKYITKN
jgi:heme/copper-type cytochrome/quinol oxidase subunit 2